MKKLLVLTLGLGVIFAVGGCNADDSTDLEYSTQSSSNVSSSSMAEKDSSVSSFPIIEGENELPLIPIG